MSSHQVTGRWKLGLGLTLTTTLLWAMLPIGLKATLFYMDGYTITWYRFAFAGIFLWGFLAAKKKLPQVGVLKKQQWFTLAVISLGLCGNYIFYMFGLEYTDAGTAQILIQLAPMLVIVGGILWFKEVFNKLQLFGLLCILSGLTLFFHHRLLEIFSTLSQYTLGVLLMLISAFCWASYALAQKQLLHHFNSQQILALVYVVGTLIFLPFASPQEIFELDGTGIVLLLFCVFNTLLAYGCFAEALVHWEAFKISAIFSVIPLLTLLAIEVLVPFFPDLIAAEPLTFLSIIGALVVVSGSFIVVKPSS